MAQVYLADQGTDLRTMQDLATGVSEHVGPDPAELRLLASKPHDVVDGLASKSPCCVREHRWLSLTLYISSVGRHRRLCKE